MMANRISDLLQRLGLPTAAVEHSGFGKITLSNYEVEVVRFLAKHFTERGELVRPDMFPRYKTWGGDTVHEVVGRLIRFRLVELVKNLRGEPQAYEAGVRILPAVFAVVDRLDNPPPEPLPDYRDKVSKWFWSKPWSVVVYLVVVGLPALLGYVVMTKTILEWTGIIKSGSPK